MGTELDEEKVFPNPGSKAAEEQGCTCPVMDNCYGKGINRDGETFWFNENCPLHGQPGDVTH